MPNTHQARLAGQLRRTLDAVIDLVRGNKSRQVIANAELEIATLADLVRAMRRTSLAPRVSRAPINRASEERLSLH
jgi:hypothetical protein